MKKFILTMLLIISFPLFTGNADTKNGTLLILVDDFKNDKGHALIALYDSGENYTKSQNWVRREKATIKEGKAEIKWTDLPFKTYAIKVFHDENDNGKLDTGMFGIPKESYGFSNNAREKFGPAKWEASKFVFDKNELKKSINLK